MEPLVRQRSQRPPHLRVHRGPAAGHLQPGRGDDERKVAVFVFVFKLSVPHFNVAADLIYVVLEEESCSY